MKRKIALKRLSSSDLTLFEHHFRKTPGAKQKGINLDKAVFLGQLYPNLNSRLATGNTRVPLELHISGPGSAGLHTQMRKILLQAKNIRLNGEFIKNPIDEPNRYDSLAKDDLALIEFAGEEEPSTAKMLLLSQTDQQDSALFQALMNRYAKGFNRHRGMQVLDDADLSEIVESLNLPDDHPALDLIDGDDLEDAAQGGIEGLTKLRKRRQARGVSREELSRARQSAEQIGRLGEEILNAWLDQQYQAGSGPEYRWDSDTNAVAPYDFTLMGDGKAERRVDAKSTSGDFRNQIHVSVAELTEMARGGVPYDLYRLYTVNDVSARLRIAKDLGEFAAGLLGKFNALPEGVTVDGVSINPEALVFGEEIIIDLSEDDGEGGEDGDHSAD
ncbi:MAG: hypothetical protein AB1831_10850 [Pseudomonadota bacterium]